MLGGDEIYEINYKKLYEERFPVEENVIEEKNPAEKSGKKVGGFFEKMMKMIKDTTAEQQRSKGSL